MEAVKQEMVRVNIDILGISEQKWTRMGEFNLPELNYTGTSVYGVAGVGLAAEIQWQVLQVKVKVA